MAAHPDRFKVLALAARADVDGLYEQYRNYRPELLCLADEGAARELGKRVRGQPVTVLAGEAELVALAGLDGADLVLNAVVGAAGLRASLRALEAGKRLALANKESLVAGGPLFQALLRDGEGELLPVDSEHSAIWQAMRSGQPQEVRRVILTSSGGPFRTWPAERFDSITVADALKHPTWKMGAKITIDSATLVNKGLEVIEAVYLFELTPSQVEVVIHPQSVVHSMVEFIDSSIIAQLSMPDMRLPITYALCYPERVESSFGRVDFERLRELTFEPPDFDKFPALRLAYEVAEKGGTATAVYNAANEVAVSAFLEGVVRFTMIPDIIARTLEAVPAQVQPDLETILDADRRAREAARRILEKTR